MILSLIIGILTLVASLLSWIKLVDVYTVVSSSVIAGVYIGVGVLGMLLGFIFYPKMMRGIAGGMNNDIHVCDVVVSSEVLPHDLDLHFLKDYPPYCGIYTADQALIDLAVKTCGSFEVKSFVGRIVSGEAFVTDSAVKAEIQQRLTPYAIDMESAAVGQCAYRNSVPFVSVRCISDNADDEGAMSFDQFEKIAAKRVADIVLRMIESL